MLARNRVALVQAFTQGIPPRRISARPASRCRDALRPPRHRICRRGHRTPRTSPSPRLAPQPPMAPFGAYQYPPSTRAPRCATSSPAVKRPSQKSPSCSTSPSPRRRLWRAGSATQALGLQDRHSLGAAPAALATHLRRVADRAGWMAGNVMLPVLVPAGDLRSADGSGERFDQHWRLRVWVEGKLAGNSCDTAKQVVLPVDLRLGLTESVAAHLHQRASVCPVVATPIAEPRVAEGKADADADAMPGRVRGPRPRLCRSR